MSFYDVIFSFFLFLFFPSCLVFVFSGFCGLDEMSLPSGWRLLYHTDEFAHRGSRKRDRERTPNYLKGVQWSPDGTCLLTSSLDKTVRLFTLFVISSLAVSTRHTILSIARIVQHMHSEHRPYEAYNPEAPGIENCMLRSSLQVREAEIVYDFCWFPLMTSMCLSHFQGFPLLHSMASNPGP